MAEVKWIKITTNIFDDEKIKLIDTMPDRDTLLVIWFKLLAMAGKTNDNGLVYVMKEMPTTDEMLATIFNRPLNTVRMAIDIFSKFKMIEVKEHINIVNWEKHQNVEGLDKIREQNRLRQAKYRENKKLIENKSNVTVTLSNGTDIEEEKEREIELEKKKNINILKEINKENISNELKEKLIEFVEYRKEIKKPIKTYRTIKTMISQIGSKFVNEEHLIMSIDDSIANQYQGVFPTKNKPVQESAAMKMYIELMKGENNDRC